MWIIWAFFIGLLIGIVAKFLMPGRDPGGFFLTALIGIGGSLLAGFLGQSLGWYLPGEPAGFVSSVVGAILILAAFRMLRSRR